MRNPTELERAKRLIKIVKTDILKKCVNDTIKTDDPKQTALNEEFRQLMVEELERREKEQENIQSGKEDYPIQG